MKEVKTVVNPGSGNEMTSLINSVLIETMNCRNMIEAGEVCLLAMCEALESRYGFIGVINEEGKFDALAQNTSDWNECYISNTEKDKLLSNMEVRGMWGEAFIQKKIIVINRPEEHTGRVGLPDGHIKLKRLMGIPLFDKGKVFGMVCVANKNSDYDDDDIKTSEELAGIIASVLLQKQNEIELRQSDEILKHLAGTVGDIIWSASGDGSKYYFINRASEEVYGMKTEEMAANPKFWLEMVYDEDKERVINDSRRLFKQGNIESEYRIVRSDGSIRWLNDRKYVLYDNWGRPKQIGGIARDITEIKKASDEIEAYQIKLESINRDREREFKCLVEMMILLDSAKDLEEVFKFTPQLVRNAHSNPEFVSVRLVIMGKEYATEGFTETLYTVKETIFAGSEKEGYLQTCYLSEKSILGEQYMKREHVLIMTLADMIGSTLSRLKIQLSLKESEEKFRHVFASSAIGKVITDLGGNILEVNQAFCRMTGYSPRELLTKTWMDLSLPSELERQYGIVNPVIAGDIDSVNSEIQMVGKSGGIICVHMSIVLLRDAAGNPMALLGEGEDITSRKKLEENLKISEERAVTQFDAIPIPTLTWQKRGDEFFLVNFNAAAFDATQGKVIKAIGETLSEEFKDYPAIIDLVWKCHNFRNKMQMESEYKFPHTGQEGYMSVHLSFAPQERVIMHMEDITDRVKTQKALKESETRYRTLAESAKDMIFIIDREMKVLYLNRVASLVFGKGSNFIIGKKLTDLFGDEQSQGMRESITAVFRNRELELKENEIVFPGKKLWLQTQLAPLPDKDGNVEAVLGISRDVTLIKQAEEALRIKDYALESSLGAFALADIEGKITYVNPSFLKLWGYVSAKDVIGSHYLKMLSNKAQVEKAVNFLRSFGEWMGELQGLRNDGRRITVQVTVSKVTGDRGQLIAYAASFADMTEIKQSAERLEYLNIELKEKNTELEQIVYVTSHDLRSPLVNILGFSKELGYSLRDLREKITKCGENIEATKKDVISALDEDLPHSIKYIESSAEKMDNLLSGLLKLSRMGRQAVKLNRLDMNEIVRKSAETIEYLFISAKAELKIAKLPDCIGDASLTGQIFSNLLENAIKYLDDERRGRIRVSGKVKDKNSIYCVEDNGRGIAEEHFQKIFELFHRLEPDKNEGEGLGLTMVKKSLEKQGGKIWVESKVGKGSKFFISLPNI